MYICKRCQAQAYHDSSSFGSNYYILLMRFIVCLLSQFEIAPFNLKCFIYFTVAKLVLITVGFACQ
jgi:hypothetical protein